MSGIGDQGMMPEHVQPRHPDDDTVDERVAGPGVSVAQDDEDAQQTEVDAALAGISDDEKADRARLARSNAPHAADADVGDTRSQRNP